MAADKSVSTIEDLKSFKMTIEYKDREGYVDHSYVYYAFNEKDGHWTIHCRLVGAAGEAGEITEMILHKDFLDQFIKMVKSPNSK